MADFVGGGAFEAVAQPFVSHMTQAVDAAVHEYGVVGWEVGCGGGGTIFGGTGYGDDGPGVALQLPDVEVGGFADAADYGEGVSRSVE